MAANIVQQVEKLEVNSEEKQTLKAKSGLYEVSKPYHHEWLRVSDLHEIYYEEAGNKDGKPILFVHGGPGGSYPPEITKFFDPTAYRIILLDQRGAGKSKPHAELAENTTWHLVDDLEKLRIHLNIEKWVVFGGSWGSTLSLVYAIKHPESVKALVLRGIFLLRRKELLWFYHEGASNIYPDAYDDYIKPIPVAERGDLISAYYRRLTGDNREVQLQCAKAWSTWEMATCKLIQDPALCKDRIEADDGKWALAFARIECHYFVNGGWFPSDAWILDNVDKIRHIPATIVQGRYDVVCPATSAWELHKKWPEAEFCFIPNAGHSAAEPETAAKLVGATDKYKEL